MTFELGETLVSAEPCVFQKNLAQRSTYLAQRSPLFPFFQNFIWCYEFQENSYIDQKDTDQPILVKKPTKWMTNCPSLATLLSVRCTGGHEHSKLEGSRRTLQASKYPTSLVQGI